MIYADLECSLRQMHSYQSNVEKSYTEKELRIRLLVTHCLQVVRLTRQKINLNVTEIKIVWKGFVRI